MTGDWVFEMLCMQGCCCVAAVCQELATSAVQRVCGGAPWGARPPGKDRRRLLQPGRPCRPGNVLQKRRQEADQGASQHSSFPSLSSPFCSFSLPFHLSDCCLSCNPSAPHKGRLWWLLLLAAHGSFIPQVNPSLSLKPYLDRSTVDHPCPKVIWASLIRCYGQQSAIFSSH